MLMSAMLKSSPQMNACFWSMPSRMSRERGFFLARSSHSVVLARSSHFTSWTRFAVVSHASGEPAPYVSTRCSRMAPLSNCRAVSKSFHRSFIEVALLEWSAVTLSQTLARTSTSSPSLKAGSWPHGCSCRNSGALCPFASLPGRLRTELQSNR